MGALYVKDEQVRFLAEQLADRRGMTKAAAVKLALVNELQKDDPAEELRRNMEEFRRTSKLTHDLSIVIDKPFYDALNDEDED